MLNRLAALRAMLHEMEQETGLDTLSAGQRDVMYAAQAVSSDDGQASLQDIQSHPLLKGMTRPTFFRHLATLGEQKLLVRVGSERSGRYQIVAAR